MGRLLLILALTGAALLLISLAAGEVETLVSVQVGYWSAVAVVLSSFASYRRMVDRRLAAGAVPEERDGLEKIEDPYELYDEENASGPETPREMLREEKKRLKQSRRSAGETARDALPAFSLWRLLAYGLLAGGFVMLQQSHRMRLAPYLLSLSVPIVVSVTYLMWRKDRDA